MSYGDPRVNNSRAVTLDHCHSAQKWRYQAGSERLLARNNTGLRLTMNGQQTASLIKLAPHPWQQQARSQRWQWASLSHRKVYNVLKNTQAGLCMDAHWVEDFGGVFILRGRQCHGGDAQLFYQDGPSGFLYNKKYPHRCVDMEDDWNEALTRVVLRTCRPDSLRWRFKNGALYADEMSQGVLTGLDNKVIRLPHGSPHFGATQGRYNNGLIRLVDFDAAAEDQQWHFDSHKEPQYFGLKQHVGPSYHINTRYLSSDGVQVTLPRNQGVQDFYYDSKTQQLHSRVGEWRCLSHKDSHQAIDGDAVVLKNCGAANQWHRSWEGGGVVFRSVANGQLMLTLKHTQDSSYNYYTPMLSSDRSTRVWDSF